MSRGTPGLSFPYHPPGILPNPLPVTVTVPPRGASYSRSLWAWSCERGSVPGVPSFSTDAHHACSHRSQGLLSEAEVAAAEVGFEPTASSPSDCSSSQGHSDLQISGGAPNACAAESVSTLCSFLSHLPDPTHLPRSQ